jgi:poly(A) polymerase
VSARPLADALGGEALIARAAAALANAPGSPDAWLVGGAVRDALLGRGPLDDADIVVSGPPKDAARHLGKQLDGAVFELSVEFPTWRVTSRPHAAEGTWSIDVAALRAPDIESDLALRDFTVNAIAVPLAEGGAAGDAIDPTGGLADLNARILRVASPTAFDDDPLRLMRLARLGAGLGLEPEAGTLAMARERAPLAVDPAGERRWAELRMLMGGADPLRGLDLLDAAGLTPVVLPDVAALRGVEQSANHHLDVHDHTIEVLRRWLDIERDIPAYAGAAAERVEEALAQPLADEMTRRDGIRFAAILHDIGKPATRTEHNGFVGFRGHDDVGADMIIDLCAELRTSRRFAEYEAAIARHHLTLGFMTHERPLSRRRIWDYISDTGREALDVTLLTVADRLSAQGSGVPEQAIEAHLDLAREMLAEIVAIEFDGPPEPLLAGDEIAALLGVEGPDIGAAVRELAAAQFSEEVADRPAAEAHLREWWGGR